MTPRSLTAVHLLTSQNLVSSRGAPRLRLQILFCRQFLPPVDQKPCFFGCSPLFDLTKRLEHPAPGTGAPQIVAIARPGRILQPGTGRCIFSSLPFAPVSSFRTCSQAPRGLSSIYPLHSGSIRTLATIARSLLLDNLCSDLRILRILRTRPRLVSKNSENPSL